MGWEADRCWSWRRRVPGSILGMTESDFLSYVLDFLEDVGTCLGHCSDIVWDTVRTCLGMCWGPFGTIWDRFDMIFF